VTNDQGAVLFTAPALASMDAAQAIAWYSDQVSRLGDMTAGPATSHMRAQQSVQLMDMLNQAAANAIGDPIEQLFFSLNFPMHSLEDLTLQYKGQYSGDKLYDAIQSDIVSIVQSKASELISDGAIAIPLSDVAMTMGPGAQQPLSSDDVAALLPVAISYWTNLGVPSSVFKDVTVSIADLEDRLVGSTDGSAITLDVTGADWGWYTGAPGAGAFDPVDGSSSNFTAKDSGPADGKMDLLTVLIHELGHVAGANDVLDASDCMYPYMAPGERRLPTSSDKAMVPASTQAMMQSATTPSVESGARASAQAAQMQTDGVRLLALQAPGFMLARAEAQDSPAGAGGLANSGFNGTDDWKVNGKVITGNGSVMLDETPDSQTRINQVFTVGPNDKFLRFTVTGVSLDNPGDLPEDAFEAALLDANTGTSLLDPISLSHTDAFLNLQGDGQAFLSDAVRVIANADGSRTYVVDLSGIAAGTAVNLSFDLLGFGEARSHVTIRDLHIGVPETLADSATTAEDTSVTIDEKANDIAADQPGFAPVIVDGPAHGKVTINADGSFGYLSDLNYNGTDSFTYKLSDGQVDSNVSTVSIVVTPVNDAPVAGDIQQTTLEDAPQTIDLLSQASDVDSPVLTPAIVQGPAHGQLALNTDGTYTYTPDANFNGTDSFSYKVNDGELDSNIATVQITVTPVNDAPTGASTTVTTLEDTPYVFQVGDFGFSDPDDAPANAFAAIVVGALPQAGSLTLDGQAVVAGQRITVADIAAGLLHFAPAANANGAGYASFTFQVQDDGGTANGGVDTDPVAKTLTLDVTSVNDAPTGTSTTVTTLEDTPYVFQVGDFGFSDPDDAPANAFAAIVVGALPQAGSLTLDGQAVVAGQRIAVADIAAGLLHFLAAPNANGDAYAGFTFRVQDDGGTANGGVDTDPTARTLTINVTPVNDPPVAAPTTRITGVEDTPYVFAWSDFPVSDIDSTTLSIVLASLPADGALQVYDGTAWVAATVGQTVTADEIAAGHLRFVPAANASGFSGFGGDGTGNLQSHYARFDYRASDGELLSDLASVVIDITPVADAPTLTLTDRPGTPQTLFRTDWEDVSDYDYSSTLVRRSTLDGWNLVREPDPTCGGQDGFEVWSEGDRMDGPSGWPRTVHAAADGGHNWLELNDARGLGHQTLGIERQVDTLAGATYTLSLDYAGRIGYSADYTAIGIYVDGVEIARYAGTSPADALDWKALSFSFVGTGGKQTIRIVSEATRRDPDGRGAMLDNLVLTQALPANTGLEDTAIPLPALRAGLTDTDGSEVLDLSILALPVGSTLSDGTHRFTATAGATTADITGWTLDALTLLPPANFNGQIALTVEATATETANGDTATTMAPLTVTVLPVDDAPVAHADSVTVREHKTVVIDVLANDTDIDSTTLDAEVVCGPRHGWLTRNADGTFSYTADCGYVGTDTFTYRASDGELASAPATVTITVTANHPPIANDDTVSAQEDTPVKIDVLANDSDADGDALTAYVVCGPEHGRLCRNDDGTWTYLADCNWYGTDTFTYRAWDDLDGSRVARVTITVAPVNDAPTARDATFRVRRDGAACIDFACLVADVDGDALTLSFASPGHGTLTRTDDGRYLYRPAQGFSGTDTFTYTVSDGRLSATATITLVVGGWACGNGASVQVTSGWASAGQTGNGCRYIVVNQNQNRGSSRSGTDTTGDLPTVDWNAQAEAQAYAAANASAPWWDALGEEPLPGSNDFAQQCGLRVKKPH
jgi:VCBS repeat-containing protein